MHIQIMFLPTAALLALIDPSTAFHNPAHHASVRTIHQSFTPFSPKLLTSTSQLQLVHDVSSIEVASVLTTDNIKVAFSVATFLPQIFWLFLILIVSELFVESLFNLMNGTSSESHFGISAAKC